MKKAMTLTLEIKEKVSLTQSSEVANMFHSILTAEDKISQEREHFWVSGVNAKNVVKYVCLVHLGSLSNTVAHPREIFRRAVQEGSAAMFVCHNHPSGDPKPSQEDILLTRRLVQAGDLLGITLLDHIILGTDETVYFSMRDQGLIYSGS